jgi:hypothetical protein
MRSILLRLSLSLSTAILFLNGCAGGPGSAPGVLPPSDLGYATETAVYTKGEAITPDKPTSTGGAPASYSVSPTLPAGLSLATTTGIISGDPTSATAKASYMVTASNSAGSSTTSLTITVLAVAPLNPDNVNLIFVVSEDSTYNASGDVNLNTANLTDQGLQRSLLMATFLQQDVLGMQNVTTIYALEPMTHLQTGSNYPDMAGLETIEEFAMLNQISLPAYSEGVTPLVANSFPLNVSYGLAPPSDVATPLLFCLECQGLDFSDTKGDNESLVTGATGILTLNVPGFYVFSAPWETISGLLAKINQAENYGLALPAGYQGPNDIYAISVTPSGGASLITYNSNLRPPSTYPTLPSPGVATAPCTEQQPFTITAAGGTSKGINTNETVYMIRHAEAHPTGFWEDGNYVAAGQWRALGLPNALQGKISPTQVYSIDPAQVIPDPDPASHAYWSYVRPSLTVEPYAIANNLPYHLVANIALFNPNAAQLTSNYFFTQGTFSGQTVLVGWEHDHIPATVDALLASYGSSKTAPPWPSDDYDTIWTVKIDVTGNLTVDNSLCEGIDSTRLPDTAPQF